MREYLQRGEEPDAQPGGGKSYWCCAATCFLVFYMRGMHDQCNCLQNSSHPGVWSPPRYPDHIVVVFTSASPRSRGPVTLKSTPVAASMLTSSRLLEIASWAAFSTLQINAL